MKNFPEGIRFKYPWRSYQKRVLDELEAHLSNQHLHVISPPGSGKTVLGLEVALRLNQPTLVLAPTVAIRNQWIQRWCDLFLQVEDVPDWISKDIRNPGFFTVVTYQALHMACSTKETAVEEESEEPEKEDEPPASKTQLQSIIKSLKKQGLGTLVLDEAHHLKNAWWKSLTAIKKALKPTVVALTATPPYDVSYSEWHRYMELNGPVDTEITVPELMVEGDLCPHQDYVFFSLPTGNEANEIEKLNSRLQKLSTELLEDKVFLEAMRQHAAFQSPEEEFEWIYSNTEYYSAILIFLHHQGIEIPKAHTEIILGDHQERIPELDNAWLEVLLNLYLFKFPDHFPGSREHQNAWQQKLKRSGAIEWGRANLDQSRKVSSFLSSSVSKLNSVQQIVDFEFEQLGNGLHMVVLTDYIRKEFMVEGATNTLELNKVGVLPIFEQIRRHKKASLRAGVLTGSLVILPVSAFEVFQDLAREQGVAQVDYNMLPYDEGFVEVRVSEQLKHQIVHLVTQVFEQSHIEVLIGTKSLLGEGWDAPSINSLVLASFVGSYVLSNQMRGRTIRSQRSNPRKTGNIWHLVCLDKSSAGGGHDMELLRRRMKGFVGVTFRENGGIENGLARLEVPGSMVSQQQVRSANECMLNQAGQREQLREKWKKALSKGVSLTEEIRVPFVGDQPYQRVKTLYHTKTIRNLAAALTASVSFFTIHIVPESLEYLPQMGLKVWLMLLLGVFIAFFGAQTYKVAKLYIKYRDISKDVERIGRALLDSLVNEGSISTQFFKLKVVTEVDDTGNVHCHLHGGSTYEKNLFITCLQEVIGKVENPRYIMIRKSSFMGFLNQRDFHSVPDVLGRKKEYATFFDRQWKRFVGHSELVYTKTPHGRKVLLSARMASLASEFDEETERVNKWR